LLIRYVYLHLVLTVVVLPGYHLLSNPFSCSVKRGIWCGEIP